MCYSFGFLVLVCFSVWVWFLVLGGLGGMVGWVMVLRIGCVFLFKGVVDFRIGSVFFFVIFCC